MAGLTSKNLLQVKDMFFDRATVKKSMDRAKLKFLSKAGAFVMTSARRSIRKTKKAVSHPGQPPRGHGQQLLKKNIFFALDKATNTTYVGPIFLNQVNYDSASKPDKGTVPSVLEHGGTIIVKEVFRWGKWRRLDQRLSSWRTEGLPLRMRRVNIAARPFMQPALEKESKNFPAMLAGTFKK